MVILQVLHGTVNKETSRYITTRKKEHIFWKYKSFGISRPELLSLREMKIQEVIILYTEDGETTAYISKLSQWLGTRLMYNDNGDMQDHLPIADMEERK